MLTLTHFFQTIRDLFKAKAQRDLDEAYLADASDLCDLERRMRAIDDRGREADSGIALGLYAR